jgi:RND family efflux transporter MFP subunit
MKKTTRKLLLSALLTFIILAIGAVGYQRMSKQKKSTISETQEEKVVRTVQVQSFAPENITNSISLDGRLTAYEVVNLFAETSGVLKPTSKTIKEGSYVKEGELLFDIDGRDAELNLLAQRSALMTAITQIMPDLKFDYPQAFEKWKKYLDEFDVRSTVKALPEITSDQEKYFVAGKNIYNLYYGIQSAEQRLNDYKIYAPFSGVVTASNIYPGQLVNLGSNLGTIMNTGKFELKAPVSLADLKYIKTGQKVTLYSDQLDKQWEGKVSRISRVIDNVTQNLPIYISVWGSGLRDGMYLKGELKANQLKDVIALDKSLITDQNKVFTVVDQTVKTKAIEIIKQDETTVYVKGLELDDEVVAGSTAGIFSGQKVKVESL